MASSRNLSNLQDVKHALDQINNVLDKLTTSKVMDLKGRRIVNAADSVDLQDYVTQKELVASIATLTVLVGIFIKQVTNAITIDGGNVTIRPGEFRILDRTGVPFKLFPVTVDRMTDHTIDWDLPDSPDPVVQTLRDNVSAVLNQISGALTSIVLTFNELPAYIVEAVKL